MSSGDADRTARRGGQRLLTFAILAALLAALLPVARVVQSGAWLIGALTLADRERLAAAGLDVAPVSLQQLIVRTTQHAADQSALDEGALR